MTFCRILIVASLFTLSANFCFAQNLEVDGTAKISDLTNDNSANSVVVVLSDGTLGSRDAITLGGSSSYSFIVGGGSGFNGFDDRANYVPMGSSVRKEILDQVQTRVPMAGTLTKFEGAITASAPNVNYSFEVIGGTGSLQCDVLKTTQRCVDLAGCVSFEEGDYIAISYTGDDPGTSFSENREGRWIGVFTPGGTCD